MGLLSLYGAAIFGVSVQALAFPGPQPTDPFQALPQNEWTPRPTPGPDPALFRRQIALPATYLLAPDNTCGFINGNSSMCKCSVDRSPGMQLADCLKDPPMHAPMMI